MHAGRLQARIGILYLAILLSAPLPAHPQWSQLWPGHQNYSVFSFATWGGTMYAGTSMGIYFTQDIYYVYYGWSTYSNSITSLNVPALAIEQNYLFAGTSGGGVFRSFNYSKYWTPANTGLKDATVHCFAQCDSVLYAATDSGIFWTSDSGYHWIPVSTGVSCQGAKALAAWGRHLYVGGSYCVVLTGDIVKGWNITNAGLPPNSEVTSFAICGANLFAGTLHGVYCSIDSGNSWKSVWTGMKTDSVFSLAAVDSCVFAGTDSGGIFMTADEGATWTSVNEGMPYRTVNVLSSAGECLFAGTASDGTLTRQLSELTSLTNKINAPAHRDKPVVCTANGTEVRYVLGTPDAVLIRLFDIHGRLIRVVLNATQSAGSHSVTIPPGISQGRYMLSVRAGDARTDRVVMVVR